MYLALRSSDIAATMIERDFLNDRFFLGPLELNRLERMMEFPLLPEYLQRIAIRDSNARAFRKTLLIWRHCDDRCSCLTPKLSCERSDLPRSR